jgi:hypothetical protein
LIGKKNENKNITKGTKRNSKIYKKSINDVIKIMTYNIDIKKGLGGVVKFLGSLPQLLC